MIADPWSEIQDGSTLRQLDAQERRGAEENAGAEIERLGSEDGAKGNLMRANKLFDSLDWNIRGGEDNRCGSRKSDPQPKVRTYG